MIRSFFFGEAELSSRDKYILALEFAQEHEEFTLRQIVEHLSLNNQHEKLFANQIHYKQIFFQDHSNYINNPNYLDLPLQFSVEDKFRLLEFTALDEARQSSNEAKKFAIAALVVSILTGIGSIYMATKQLNSDVNLPEKVVTDFSAIKSDIHESKVILLDMKKSKDTNLPYSSDTNKK